MSEHPTPVIRPITEADLPGVVAMVHQLAAYERDADACTLTEGQLRAAIFVPNAALYGHVGEIDGELAGISLWFLSFSTWEGKHGIYLEDLFVSPAKRRSGVGLALLRELASICVARDYGRLEWSVLDWNTLARGFYRSLGAHPMDEWHVWRLHGAALARLEGNAPD
ncbi:MAG: GNAT family N-acetyltransferase [Mycobacteriales bacterium]